MFLFSADCSIPQKLATFAKNENYLKGMPAMDRGLLAEEFEDMGLTIPDDMIDECKYIVPKGTRIFFCIVLGWFLSSDILPYGILFYIEVE